MVPVLLLLMSLSFTAFFFFLNLILLYLRCLTICAGNLFVSGASEVVQVVCLFPVPRKLCIFCFRCLRSCAGYICGSIKLMHERNKISIEFPYDVPYDSDSGHEKKLVVE